MTDVLATTEVELRSAARLPGDKDVWIFIIAEILDFMELRHAPLVWRLALEGWLLVVSLIILSVYWLGTTAN